MIAFDILVVLWRGIFVMSLPGLPGPSQLDVLLLLMSFHKYLRGEFNCIILWRIDVFGQRCCIANHQLAGMTSMNLLSICIT